MSNASEQSREKPRSLWAFFVLGLILIALFLIGSKALITIPASPAEEDAARAAERSKARETLDAETRHKLDSYGWVDRAKGQVQVPITEAMRIVTARLAAEEPRPAGPVNPVTTAEPPAPDAAAPPTAAPAAPTP